MAYPADALGITTTPTGGTALSTNHVLIHTALRDAALAAQAHAVAVDGRLDDLEDAPSGGVTDHGALTGLADDDHAQYHTDARGDARYSALAHDHDADYETAGAVATHAAGAGVHAVASVTGLQTALDAKSATSHDHAATYAPIASGVTNGDTHDHNGGDGAQIAYSTLSGLPALGGAAALNVGTGAGTVAAGDDARLAAETAASIGALIAGATAKAVPLGADSLGLSDSAASGVLKKTTITDLLEAIYKAGVLRAVMSVGTPFVLPPGDGSANGLQFTGSAGDYTLSAAITANAWAFLGAGFWMYMPASFGGSAYPAGWYWSVMSSDTAGILYTDTYTSGVTSGPSSPTVFPSNLTGWLTTTTNEIVGPTGFTLPAGALGKSGELISRWKLFGNAAGTKNYFQSVNGTKVLQANSSTSPAVEIITSMQNAGTESAQKNTRSPASVPIGVGASAAVTVASAALESTSIDTTVDQTLSISMKLSTTTACAILLGYTATASYGA